MKNRYFEVLEHIIKTIKPEAITEYQNSIAPFLEYAKRDDFWVFINQKRRDFNIKIEDYGKICKQTVNGDSTYWDQYNKPLDEDEYESIMKYCKKQDAKLSKKSKKSEEELEKLAFYRTVQSFIIGNNNEFIIGRIKNAVDLYIKTKGKEKMYAGIENMTFNFLLFDLSCLKYDIFHPGGTGYISIENGIALVLDKFGQPSMRIFKNTNLKRLRKTFKDKEFKKQFEYIKRFAPTASPIKNKQPKYGEKLLLEYERAKGKSYGEILSKKNENLDADELLNNFSKNKEKKELNRLRQLNKKR